MPHRHPSDIPVPRHWLMTDERAGNALPRMIAAMPPRGGVVVRPYALRQQGRAQLIRAIRRAARARRHLLLIAGTGSAAGFDGRHGAARAHKRRGREWLTLPVHDRREAMLARRLRADAVLISPVFATRSHPGAQALGPAGFARLAALAGRPAIALGGMTAARFIMLRHRGAHGWAAIDAWLPARRTAAAISPWQNQKRNWVPT